MVQAKKSGETSTGTRSGSNMSFSGKDGNRANMATNKMDMRGQNGSSASFRTDSAISGSRFGGERVLQRWQPDASDDVDGSLEGPGSKSSGGWDQFAENSRRFGLTTDYNEDIYTTTIDKSHPQYKQRLADAERKEREILRSAANNSHVAEERVTDNLNANGNGVDEEDKYSGVRRQHDFPPLGSSSNKYMPPARRVPIVQATVAGAPVDPAIISSQLARPEKQAIVEKSKPVAAPKPSKTEAVSTSSFEKPLATPDAKSASSSVSASASRIAPPKVKGEGGPNATATVERDVASSFKAFAAQQRKTVDQIRKEKLKHDKDVKLNDLRKFADNFKLHTPVPKDLVSIIAKDPVKQKEIQEKAKRNAEAAKTPTEPTKSPISTIKETKPSVQRPPTSTASQIPATTTAARQTGNGRGNFPHQPSQNSRSSGPPAPTAQHRQGNTGVRTKGPEQSKHAAPQDGPRLPPTGPSNANDPNFSRRSSGVGSAQGARLNPNSTEFRPNPFANSFSPTLNPSSASSPRSAVATEKRSSPPVVARSFLRRSVLADTQRPSLQDKFNALEYIKSIKPVAGKNWDATGGLKPAYDTPPTWRTIADDEKADSTMHITYSKLFDMTAYVSTMSPHLPSAIPPVPHQHQLPFHLQHTMHSMGMRQSPRQPHMSMHSGPHGHAPNASYAGSEDHRMVPSHSAQSFASPRLGNAMAFPSPMNQSAQLSYNGPMMPYGGAPPMGPYRSMSQSQGFMPHQGHMGPIVMNAGNGFMAAQGMPPGGPQMMYHQGNQGHFIPPANGHPPSMPANGFPSPGRGASMMSQGSQQGQQPMYGMSPGPQFGNVAPIYAQQQNHNQMPMRGYQSGPAQFGTSPQQHSNQFSGQHRNQHNGHYNKSYSQNSQTNGPPNPTTGSPQVRSSDVTDDTK